MNSKTDHSSRELLERADVVADFDNETVPLDDSSQGATLLRMLWDEKSLLWRVVRYGFWAGILMAFLIPNRFESTARLMPPDNQSSSGLAMLASMAGRTNSPGVIGGVAGDLLGMKSSGSLFVGVLKSRTVEDRIIQKFDLKKAYWAMTMESARDALERNLSIAEDRKSGIISITVTDRDPILAQAIALEFVQVLNRLMADLTTSAAHRERVFIEERLKVVKKELDLAAEDFSQFASKNTTIDIKEQGRAMVEAAANLQGQLIAAQTELEGLKQIYADNNVRVRSVRARIAELQKQLDKLGGKEVGLPNLGARPTEAASMYPSIRMLPLLGVKYSDLLRRTKITEVVYELLTQQFELARVQEAKEIPVVKILDEPVVPERRSYPPRLLIVMLCPGVCLLVACLCLVGTSRWESLDSHSPLKAFALEIYVAVNGHLRGAMQRRSWIGRLASWKIGGLKGNRLPDDERLRE